MDKLYRELLELYSSYTKPTGFVYYRGDVDVYPIELTLTKHNAPYPIPSGSMVFVNVRRSDGVMDKYSAAILDADKGLILHTVSPGEISVIGELLFNVEIQTPDERLTWPSFRANVFESVDDSGPEPPEELQSWVEGVNSQLVSLREQIDQGGGGGGVTVHGLLTGRDVANQHPTSAITGLDAALNAIAEDIAEIGLTATSAEETATAAQQGLAQEILDRATAINAMTSALSQESQYRIDGDNALGLLVDQLGVRLDGMTLTHVFDTVADMETALADPEFVATLVVGANLLIRDPDAPDFWWDGTQALELETEKIDLSNFYTRAEIDTLLASKADKTYVDGKISETNTTLGGLITNVLNGLNAHTGNTANPHAVTKTQVGLGNVDNTSDANKPISTAQAAVNTGVQTQIGALEQGALPKIGGTMTGTLTAVSPTDGTGKVRNIFYGTTEPDNSLGADGDIYILLS